MTNQESLNRQSTGSNNALWLNQRIVNFPIWFFQFYLTVSVFVFAFGPWPWPVPDPVVLYLFLFFAQWALWVGYKTGLRTSQSGYYGRWEIDRLIQISLILNLIWIIPNFMLRMGINGVDFGGIINAVTTGFLDPGVMYASKNEALAEIQKTSLLGYVTQVISPIQWLLIPLSVVYWHRISRKYRVAIICFIIIDLMTWIATGTNKGLADFIILMPFLFFAARPELIALINSKSALKFFVCMVIGISLLLCFFVVGQQGRGGGDIPTYDSSAQIQIDKDNWMVCYLPPSGQGAVAALTTYVVQGYYALSLALEEPFDSTFGVGNSYYLTGIIQSFVGQGVISDRTYPAKIEKYGWDRFGKWHSFYTWIASDVSFPGVILVVFLIGRLFSMVWLDVLHKENPFAVALFALLVIMLFYFPANNQVLAFSRTATAFWVMLVCWIFTRKRYVW
jgi:hypothetical protein